jgi:hypothetical protein
MRRKGVQPIIGFCKTTAFRIHIMLLYVIITLATGTAKAQEPGSDYVIYLPIVMVPAAWPYNVKAVDLVLQPADMPPGYELDEEESGPAEPGACGQGAVDAYIVWYSNDDLLFTGTPVVANVAAIFRTPQEARDYVQCARDYAAGQPDFRWFISVPQMGDETLAYEFVSEDGILPVTSYSILIRKGNLITHIATGAISLVADFSVTMNFAWKALARLENEIAGLDTEEPKMSGGLSTQESKETRVQLELIKELLESQVNGQW